MKISDDKIRKQTILQFTIYAVIASMVIFIAAFFINAISSGSSSDNIAGSVKAFYHHNLFWIISFLTALAPVVTYIVTSILTRDILGLQNSIDSDEMKMSGIFKITQSLLKEDFSSEIKISDDSDKLSVSLIELRDKLKLNRENDILRRDEENRRNWLAEGQAHFSEILRNNINDPEKMSFLVLKDLTKYINAVQGGFYILDDSDKDNRFFNLISFFAYDRKKFANQQIKWGDGLIGTCALERKTIHMKKVPDKYIRVTSGLGEANPKGILLEPLLHENEVYGVLEFATMESFQPQQINLVTKIAKHIGSTLASAKSNLNTSRMLEDSRAQANIMASQEEEMRQNMEELKATQEEAARQASQIMTLENSINMALIRADLDSTGVITGTNKLFLEKLQFKSQHEVENKHILDFICNKDLESFKSGWWNDIISGKGHFEGQLGFLNSYGNEIWFTASFTPVKDEDGKLQKILLLALDMSSCQQQILKLEPVNRTIERIGVRIETDIHGTILNANKNFMQISGITQKELNIVTVFDLLDSIDSEVFVRKWESVVKGTEVDSQIRIISRSGNEKWLDGSLTGIYDISGQICRIAFIGRDVTEDKVMENENRSISENLLRYEKMYHESEKESNRKIKELKTNLTTKYKEAEKLTLKYESLLDDTSDAVLITGSDNGIVFFNRAAEKLWGIERSKVLDQHLGVLFPAKSIENDDFMKLYTGPGDRKITGVRRNITVTDVNGIARQCIILLSRAKVEKDRTYIAFIQQIEPN